jgi:hypothetical protein
MPKKLIFKLLSHGSIAIDYNKCKKCDTHACVKHCQSSHLTHVLVIKQGLPVLARPDEDTGQGWCTECCACELNCSLYGKKAISIDLPL